MTAETSEWPKRGALGIASLPGFRESLRLLYEEERYSASDIGLMFGVSRERVRQLLMRYGYEIETGRGLHAVRVWNDALHRFQPVGKGEWKRDRQREASMTKRAARDVARRQRRVEIVATLVALKTALGREPTGAEMATAVMGREVSGDTAGATLAAAWGIGSNTPHYYTRAMAEIRQATGLTGRPPGMHGHLHPYHRPPIRRDAAAAWLRTQLAAGMTSPTAITQAARASGIAHMTLKNAAKHLGVVSTGVPGKRERVWTLPEATP